MNPYGYGPCPRCGGDLIGDGYNTVLHCENAEEAAYEFHEPDAQPVLCDFTDTPTATP